MSYVLKVFECGLSLLRMEAKVPSRGVRIVERSLKCFRAEPEIRCESLEWKANEVYMIRWCIIYLLDAQQRDRRLFEQNRSFNFKV